MRTWISLGLAVILGAGCLGPSTDQVAYWENATRTTLPTQEEARWLVLQYAAKVNALSAQDLWEEELRVVDRGYDWTAHPERAVRAVALQDVPWPFAELGCQPMPTA